MERKIQSAEEARKQYDLLPPEVKALLYSERAFSIIKQVGEKHQLHIDQIGLLEAETNEVMMGSVETKDYPQALVEMLNIDRLKADAIAQDINDQLFVKIRDAMKHTYEQNKEGGEKPKVPPPPQQAKPAPPIPQVKLTPLAPAAAPVPLPQQMLAPKLPAVTPADLALSQKTVSTPKPLAPPMTAQSTTPLPSVALAKEGAKPEAPKPGPYKADPYREPAE